jgi:multidrug efflux pump subunit AcrA (membrane-fusion protein)
MQRVTALIAEIVPAVDPVSRSVLVKLALPASPHLRSGQFGRAMVATAPERLLTIADGAVLRRGQLTLVMVADGERAVLRMVRCGDSRDGRTVIRPERVIIDDASRLSDGQAISLR